MLFIKKDSPEPFSVRRKLTSETGTPETKVSCQEFTSGILSKHIKLFCSPKPQKADYSIKAKQINQTKDRQFWLEMKRSSRIPVSSRTPEFSWNLYKQLHTSNSKYGAGLQILVRNTGSHILWLAERSSKCLLPNLSRYESNTSLFHGSPWDKKTLPANLII